LLGEGLADALDNIKDLKSGGDYNVLVLSFDKNDIPEKAREYRKKLQRQLKFAGINEWVFATAKEEDIKSITESAGYRFYSAEDKTFVHPSVFIFLSPERKITRYIFGVKPDPFTVRLAILESVTGRIGKVPVSSLITLACYKYDSETHGYILNLQVLFASVGVVLAVMTGILSVIVYRKKKSLRIG
jgi:protein SCO1/2